MAAQLAVAAAGATVGHPGGRPRLTWAGLQDQLALLDQARDARSAGCGGISQLRNGERPDQGGHKGHVGSRSGPAGPVRRLRRWASARSISRETCICEMPSRVPISAWVRLP